MDKLEAANSQAALLYKAKDYKGCINKLTRALSYCKDKSSRIEVLDKRALCYEKLDKIDLALNDGIAIIKQSKSDPRGYLRSGKLYLIQKEAHKARQLYDLGLQRVPQSHPLRKVLERQKLNLDPKCELDPIKILPPEIIDIIFCQTSFITLVKCRGVCKSWKLYLETASYLWRSDLDFSSAKLLRSNVLSYYLNLSRPVNMPGRRIKLLNLARLQNEKKVLDYLVKHHNLFDELKLSCDSVYLAEILLFYSTIPRKPCILFSNLHKLTLRTVINPKYVLQIVNRIPSLRELDYWLIVERSNLCGHDISDETLRLRQKNSNLNDIYNSFEPKDLLLESFRFWIVGSSAAGAHFLNLFNPIFRYCSRLKRLELSFPRQGFLPDSDDLDPRGEIQLNTFADFLQTKFLHLETLCLNASILDEPPSVCISSPKLKRVMLEDLDPGLVPRGRIIASRNVQQLCLTGFRTRRPLNFPFNLANILDATNLSNLDMNNSLVPHFETEQGFSSFIGVRLMLLRRLTVNTCHHVNDTTINGIVNMCPNLEELDIGSTKVTGTGLITAVNSGIKRIGVENLDIALDTIEWASKKVQLTRFGPLR